MFRRRKLNRCVFAVFTDTHGGHRLGLCNPKTVLWKLDHDGLATEPWTPSQSRWQRYLWPWYEKWVHEAEEFAADDDLFVAHNGDLTQGNRYGAHLVSDNVADQVEIAHGNMAPWYKIPNLKAVRLVAGTDWHVFGQGASERLVAKLLGAEFRKVETRAYYHGLLDVRGVDFDVAHHGPYPGSRNWLDGNVAMYYLRSLMMDEIMAQIKPPRMVLRGHYHRWVRRWLELDAMGGTVESTLIIVPAMCGPGSYARKVTRSMSRVTNGMVLFEIIDGKLTKTIPLRETRDLRTKESL